MVAVVAMLLATGACASHPERPATSPRAQASPAAAKAQGATPTRAPAGVLDGCQVLFANVARDTYGLVCGKDLAFARRETTDAAPEDRVAVQVSGLTGLLSGDLETAPMHKPLPIGGTPRPATMMALFREPRHHDDKPTWLGVASGWRTGPHQVLVLACGGPRSAEAGKRCGRLMGWMATHPKLPAGLPRAPANALPDARPWISEAALPTPEGCARLRSDTRHLHLRCPEADLVLTRIEPLAGPPTPRGLKAVMDALGRSVVKQARKQHATGATLEVSTCTVGRGQGVCGRVRFDTQGQHVALDLAVGGLFHGLTTVECFHSAGDAALPALCAKVMSLATPGAGPTGQPTAEAPPAHLLDGCHRHPAAAGAVGYDLDCGPITASVATVSGEQALDPMVHAYVERMARRYHGSAEVGHIRMPIAGHRRDTTVVAVHTEAAPNVDAWFGFVAAWHTGDGRSVLDACGGTGLKDDGSGPDIGHRCKKLLEWMAVHPAAP